jgi:hypothetical protein
VFFLGSLGEEVLGEDGPEDGVVPVVSLFLTIPSATSVFPDFSKRKILSSKCSIQMLHRVDGNPGVGPNHV